MVLSYTHLSFSHNERNNHQATSYISRGPFIVLTNPIIIRHLIAHITKVIWSDDSSPIWTLTIYHDRNRHKANRMHKLDTRHNPNNVHLRLNPSSHVTWRNFVVLVIYFTNKTCICTCFISWEQPIQSSLSPTEHS